MPLFYKQSTRYLISIECFHIKIHYWGQNWGQNEKERAGECINTAFFGFDCTKLYTTLLKKANPAIKYSKSFTDKRHIKYSFLQGG